MWRRIVPDTACVVRRAWYVVRGTVFVVRETEPIPGAAHAEGTFVALRIAVGTTVAVIWVGYMLVLLALGSCDAFGGRCDGTSPPVFEDDVAGGAFIGTAAAAWILWWLCHPSKRQAAVGVGGAIAVAAVVALLARGIADG